MKLRILIISALCVVSPPLCGAEEFELIGKAGDFVQTGADNSLTKLRGLFKVRGKEGKRRLETDSEETNIHAHYRKNGSARFRNYTYTGKMKIEDPQGAVGVTFYSDYPKSDTYYRLRMFSGGSFHIAPHPDQVEYNLTGTTDTGVVPQAGVWQNFKIQVRTTKNSTKIKAKVWPQGARQPRQWQVDCEDTGANRLTRGKPGVWSFSEGSKAWSKLVVKTKG